jgi:hypothetical protein
MHGVLVPDVHFEALLFCSVVCPHPFILSFDQFINYRLHVHTHILLRVSRNYQRQDHVMSLKGDVRGEIEGDNKHGPTCVRGGHLAIWIEPICCQSDTYITSLIGF